MEDTFLDLLLALLLGVLVGLERGTRKEYEVVEIVGIRTFGLIGLFGGFSALIGVKFNVMYTVISFLSISIFLIVLYIMEIRIKRGVGATTVISALITYSLGVLVILDQKAIAAAFAVITVIILSLKPKLHLLIKKIDEDELYAIFKFLLISVVILPFLPNKTFGPFSALNPFELWLFVVMVAGISFIGYFLIKILGETKGIFLTAFFGGLASSTALTLSFSKTSKDSPFSSYISAGILIASAIMFPRILIIVAIINIKLAYILVFPMLFLAFVMLCCAFFIYIKRKKVYTKEKTNNFILTNPFKIWPAIKFGLLLALIIFITYTFKYYFGDYGVYAISFLSGFADVDAISLSLSAMSRHEMSINIAGRAILIASLTNTMTKGIFVIFLADRNVAKEVFLAICFTMLVGVIFLVLF